MCSPSTFTSQDLVLLKGVAYMELRDINLRNRDVFPNGAPDEPLPVFRHSGRIDYRRGQTGPDLQVRSESHGASWRDCKDVLRHIGQALRSENAEDVGLEYLLA